MSRIPLQGSKLEFMLPGRPWLLFYAALTVRVNRPGIVKFIVYNCGILKP